MLLLTLSLLCSALLPYLSPYLLAEWVNSHNCDHREPGILLVPAVACRGRQSAVWRFSYTHNLALLTSAGNTWKPLLPESWDRFQPKHRGTLISSGHAWWGTAPPGGPEDGTASCFHLCDRPCQGNILFLRFNPCHTETHKHLIPKDGKVVGGGHAKQINNGNVLRPTGIPFWQGRLVLVMCRKHSLYLIQMCFPRSWHLELQLPWCSGTERETPVSAHLTGRGD